MYQISLNSDNKGYQTPTFNSTSTLPMKQVDFTATSTTACANSAKKVTTTTLPMKVGGYIYYYTCIAKGKYNQMVYVGACINEAKRKMYFTENVSYAGKKIDEAREKCGTGSNSWEYNILIYVPETLDQKATLDILESFGVAMFDSYYHGLNGNIGGSGRGPTAVNVTKEGTTTMYHSVRQAADALNLSQATIYIHRKDGSSTRDGIQLS